jgi:peptide/nickel transport system substrate-binding protein
MTVPLKRLAQCAALALVASALLGTAVAQPADNRPTLRVAVQANPPTAEVLDAESNVGYRAIYSVHDTLMQIDFAGDYTVKGHLAQSWKWITPTVLEVTLKRGVKFHDNSEMTADDVVFSFGPERLTGEKAPGRPMVRRYWVSLDKVEKVSPYVVRFTTKYEDPIFEQRLTAWTSQIISKAAYLKAGSYDAWRLKPIGAGPYKIERITPNDAIVLTAHDGYWGGKPNAKTVVFKVVPEVASRIAGLLAGDYDIATDLPPDQLEVIDRNKAKGVSVVGGPINNHRVIWFDKNNPVLKDPRVRQAMILAIDRKAIVDSIWNGRTKLTNGLQYDFFGKMYLKDYPAYRYDPEGAKKLLTEAKYKGEEITFRGMNNYYTAELPTDQAMIAMWQAVGLNVRLVMVEPGGGLMAPASDRAAGDWSNSALLPDPLFSLWSQHGPASTQKAQGIWENEEFYKLGEKLERSIKLEDRRAAFKAMLDISEWTDPGISVLHQNAVFYGIRNNVDWKPYVFLYMDLAPQRLKFK